jgi:serine/threonine protein kinase
MTAAALPENYCVCVGEDGAPREIGRSGAAVTYKAMGYQSGQAVALQLIPLANVSEAGRTQFELKARAVRKLKHPNIARVLDVREEDEHLVFATEFLQGETAERWVVTHGPMPPDAVLRIGLQVVSALAEAAFHSLSHRAIQPSNLMIVSGAAPDGDWPFVKLLNFGFAGLKLYSEGTDELAPPIGAAFASPEQLEKGKVDFRSEIFSLGATMCFLLTGAMPLAGRARKSGESERILPSSIPIPRVVRRLLRHMLRINPDERPHDPLLVTDELRRCLKKVERRRALSRQSPLPLQVEEQSLVRENRSLWLGPLLTAVTVLLLLMALGAVVWPGKIRRWAEGQRPLEAIGVPVGVDENSPANKAVASTSVPPVAEENSSPTAAVSPPPPSPIASPKETVAPVVAENSPAAEATPAEENVKSSPSASQEPQVQIASEVAQETSTPVPVESPAATPAAVITNDQAPEPSPPGEAPPAATASPPPENVAPVVVQQEPPAAAPQQNPAEEPATALSPPPPQSPSAKTSAAKTASAIAAATHRSSVRARPVPTMRVGTERARLVGTTDEGKWILRLPSGQTIVTPPVPDTNDAPVISHRRVRKVRIPPRAVPAGGPPVLVLPPEN